MKKTLIFIVLLCCSIVALAVPDPRKKNQTKARITNKNTSIPLPPKVRK